MARDTYKQNGDQLLVTTLLGCFSCFKVLLYVSRLPTGSAPLCHVPPHILVHTAYYFSHCCSFSPTSCFCLSLASHVIQPSPHGLSVVLIFCPVLICSSHPLCVFNLQYVFASVLCQLIFVCGHPTISLCHVSWFLFFFFYFAS